MRIRVVGMTKVPTPAYPLTDMQEIIFRQFWLVGNFTDSELNAYYSSVWQRFGWPQVRHDTPRKRRSELSNLGLLADSGVKRPNGFGRDERVWTIAEVGK